MTDVIFKSFARAHAPFLLVEIDVTSKVETYLPFSAVSKKAKSRAGLSLNSCDS
jgi:hypothetical protein